MFLKSLLVFVALALGFAAPLQEEIVVYLVGDSTMSEKAVKAFPETGWGTPFGYFFDETVKVENHAKNGRSTRTFIEENRWQPIVDKLNPGDYVLIQFGHNDEVPTKKSATTEDEFQRNLKRYVSEARNKGANPVLITPVARRRFDDAGNVVDTHEKYAALVRKVAAESNVPLVDLDRKSRNLLEKFGPDKSKLLFNHLEPGEHPNYPEGLTDNTHFNELGARKMAQLVLHELQEQQIDLAERIVNAD